MAETLDVENLTAHGFDEDFVLQQLRCGPSADSRRLVDLVDPATMIGTPAALAWLIDSIVCGITVVARDDEDGDVRRLGAAARMAREAAWRACR